MIFSIAISLANAACVVWSIGAGDINGTTYVTLFFAVTLAFIAGTEK